jgi:hypothetical protein
MNRRLLSFLLAPLAACGAPEPSARASAPSPRPPRPSAHAAAVADLVGVWAGQASHTPLGPFPMALVFDRAADGAIHARLDGQDGMYLAFRFHRQGDDWLLTEEGFLPGVGKQLHVLVPVADGAGARWVDREDAAALALDIQVDRKTLRMATRLRGEDHARFELRRMEGEAADQVRARIARPAAPAGAALSSPR